MNRKSIFNEMIGAQNLTSNRLANLWNISLPALLRYEDKSSMAFSVEARLPFLDHRLVELIFSLPFDYLIKHGWTKYILREAMKNKIPEDIRMRKGKLAFSVPQKIWLKEIRDYIKTTLTEDFRSGRYLNKNELLKMCDSDRINEKSFYRAFGFEKWMKVFDLKS
jgi:asparagine synthase (glutamine-hydrolysing)